jgi:hypothetical protein
MVKLRSLSSGLAAVALLVAGAASAQEMTVSIAEGATFVQHAGASASEPIAGGAALREGDTVQTGTDGHLEIVLANGSTLRVGPSASLTLQRAGRERTTFSAKLLFGSVWAKVSKLLAGETFEVETENGVAGVRGTEFLVDAAADGEHSLRVYEGTVAVRDRAGAWEHAVTPGRELLFRRGIRPLGLRAFDAAADRRHPLMRWVRERPPPDRRSLPRPKKEHRQRKRKMFERLQYRR